MFPKDSCFVGYSLFTEISADLRHIQVLSRGISGIVAMSLNVIGVLKNVFISISLVVRK